MSATADKARAQRLQRLQSSLDHCLEHPEAALETLMLELQMGELHPESWEGLHAAAAPMPFAFRCCCTAIFLPNAEVLDVQTLVLAIWQVVVLFL